jgi:DNA modification methylase
VKAISEHDLTVYQGDVREQLAALEPGSVNCVCTSPPYFGLRDYGVDGQIGLEASPAEYVAEMVGVFREVRRVLADDGVCWLNLGDSYSNAPSGPSGATSQSGSKHAGARRNGLASLPHKNLLGIPWRVAFALQDDGWTLRNAAIWHKPNAMPESVTDRLSTRYEHVFLLSKSRRYWFDLDAIREPQSEATVQRLAQGPVGIRRDQSPGEGRGRSVVSDMPNGRNPGDVWTVATSPFPGAHFATMPPELARRCILAGCPENGTVLDPFAGSGTTLMVARKLGRKAVGVELNPDYIDIIRDRIGQTPLDFGETA